MEVFLVDFEVFGKLADSLGENCYLHFRRTCVVVVSLILSYDRLLLVFLDQWDNLLCNTSEPGTKLIQQAMF